MRQVVIDLPPHAFNLLCDRGGKLRLSGIVDAARLVRENGQRSLQSVSEIARFGLCATHCLFTMLEKGIQIVNQRLNFVRIRAHHALVASFANGSQTRLQVFEGRHGISNEKKAAGDTAERNDRYPCAMRQRHHIRKVEEKRAGREVCKAENSEGP